jgi:hypothetical protein
LGVFYLGLNKRSICVEFVTVSCVGRVSGVWSSKTDVQMCTVVCFLFKCIGLTNALCGLFGEAD